MHQPHPPVNLSLIPLAKQKKAFAALVEAQDAGMNVAESHRAVADRFGLFTWETRAIELVGSEADWPPFHDLPTIPWEEYQVLPLSSAVEDDVTT